MTTAVKTTSRRRLRATGAAALLGVTMLGGCAVMSPVQTDYNYQAADGVNGVDGSFGSLEVTDLLVLSDTKGGAGTVIGQLVNRSDEDAQVVFATESVQSAPVTVPRHGSMSLGSSGPVTLSAVPVAPGEMLQLRVRTPATGENVITVPVLPPTGYYEGFGPKASPSPSATP